MRISANIWWHVSVGYCSCRRAATSRIGLHLFPVAQFDEFKDQFIELLHGAVNAASLPAAQFGTEVLRLGVARLDQNSPPLDEGRSGAAYAGQPAPRHQHGVLRGVSAQPPT